MRVAQELEPTSVQASTPRRTGSFEISCGLPTGKAVFPPRGSAGPPQGSRTSEFAAPGAGALALPQAGSEAVNHSPRPTTSPWRLPSCDSGRWEVPAARLLPLPAATGGEAVPAGAGAGPGAPSRATRALEMVPRGGRAAGPCSGARQTRLPTRPAPRRRHSPKNPCTIPSGWLSQSSPHGISPGAGAGVDRAEAIRGPSAAGRPAPSSSSAARPLLARVRSRPPTHSEPRGAGLPRLRERRLRWGRGGAAGDSQAGAYGPLAFTSHNGGK